jgi:dipeptidyl aminopeptidase/acylaminoacyl peptidase
MKSWTLAAAAAFALAGAAGAAEKRAVNVDDLARLQNVATPDIDPKGEWVAYAVSGTDSAADKGFTHVWMSRWDGSREVQLTGRIGESESTPHFSPDGRWLGFISSRDDKKERDQLWLLDRVGGEARKPVELDGSVVDYAWSPDSRRIALILQDPEPNEAANAAAQAELPPTPKPGEPATTPRAEAPSAPSGGEAGKPKPIVIDRFQFKRDIDGYLRTQRQRLVLLDLDTGKTRRLTNGDHDEFLPAWSPDGKRIAFVSNRDSDPDRSYNHDLFVVDAASDRVEPTRLTRFKGSDNDPDWESYPAWSPDGRAIAYLQGGPVELFSYGVRRLAVIPAAGGEPRILTASLDRNVTSPAWSADGRSLSFLVEDDGIQWIGQVAAAGGAVKPVATGRRVFRAIDREGAKSAVLMTDFANPPEIYALEGDKVRALSRRNAAWLSEVRIAPVEETKFRSRDGTEVHGFLVRPAAAPAGPLPTLLRIHGGPQSQYDLSFNFDFQLFAANGYAVVAANPRGSTGRGQDYAKGIYAAWGSVDVQDVLAAVDDAVARGIADPDRLGIGGWSYGGMLTNYTIASDSRFKAATSGASIANILAGYGVDQYIRDYEMELGRPWEKPEVWMRVSYPFFHSDRIVTPTLFLGGDKDFNVPLIGSEQMYQALRSRGIDTWLVIYPGQFHGLKRPSFLKDRLQRYLDWYGKRLKG